MSRDSRHPSRLALAVAGSTAVVIAELTGVALSAHLTASLEGAAPGSVSLLPIAVVSVAVAGVAVVVGRRADDGAVSTVSGVTLVLVSPVTAFGGGCGVATDGASVFRSGVRIGITVGDCVTFLNGAMLVLGYGLLWVGLWLAADRLPLPDVRRWRLSRS